MTKYKNKSFKQETKNNQPIFLEKNKKVRAKKHLGQHFLNDENIAQKIADTLSLKGYQKILEIGSGMGILTKYLLKKPVITFVIEIDQESVTYLQTNYKELKERILNEDFLRYKLEHIFNKEQFAIIGNFPYNISTQIVFKMLEYRSQIPEFSGMFQKEVAERICEKKGTKSYGILSVLVQAFYDAEYLFTVNETVFSPPPKVKSGILHLKRKENYHLSCDEHLFFTVVKTAFNQRRKTLRNSLKLLYTVHKTSTQKIKNTEKESEANDIITDVLKEKTSFQENNILDLRPEQIDYIDFITLTNKIKANEF